MDSDGHNNFVYMQEESDVEWKFARSILYLEYMGDGEVLPVPLNLARIPRAICEWVCDCGEGNDNFKEPPTSPFNDIDVYENMTMARDDVNAPRNGVEVRTLNKFKYYIMPYDACII